MFSSKIRWKPGEHTVAVPIGTALLGVERSSS